MVPTIESEFKKIFDNILNDKTLETAGNFHNPLFNARNVMDLLDFDSIPATRNELIQLLPLEYKQIIRNSKKEKEIYITQAGLFALIFQSKHIAARQFQKFVFETVLADLVQQTIGPPTLPKSVYLFENKKNPDHFILTTKDKSIKDFKFVLDLQIPNQDIFFSKITEMVHRINSDEAIHIITTGNHFILNNYPRFYFVNLIKWVARYRSYVK